MKITLDLDKLLAQGEISEQEYRKLQALAASASSTLAFNILLGFGLVAVCGATIALVPTALTAIVLGFFIFSGGIGLLKANLFRWKIFASICVLLGALMLGGGMIWADAGSARACFATVILFSLAGIIAQNSLLIALATLAIAPTVGANTGYAFASYYFGTNEPTLMIVVFSLLGYGLYRLALMIPPDYASLAITGARTSVFLANLGFWIASLWGDTFVSLGVEISAKIYAILWALALLATGIWAWKQKRTWLLNMVATFGGIHFYTQFFERLGATPWTVLFAGILALIFAITLRTLNLKLKDSSGK